MPDLLCPRCPHREWISPDDPDAAVSEMYRHLSRDYPEDEALRLLGDVEEVPDAV